MRVLYGATPNQCEQVGGWLPFTVDCESSTSYKIRGTRYQTYKSGVFESAEQAAAAARVIACENSEEVTEVVGCVRCYEGGWSGRHLVREEDNSVSCGHCGRCLVTFEEVDEMKASIARVFRVTDGEKCFSCEAYHDHFLLRPEDGSKPWTTVELSLHGLRKC